MEADESFRLRMEEKQPENKTLHFTQAAIVDQISMRTKTHEMD